MAKIAFIDLQFHKKTKSSVFFQNILEKEFDVDVFYEDEIKECLNGSYEKYIYWQISPDFIDLLKIKDKQIIFIPMYDTTPINKLAWERFKCFKFKIICFCKKLYDFFTEMGFECFYIQYYPPEIDHNVDYSNKKIFFWYRGNITWDNVKTIIGEQNVSITIKNNPDPGYKPLELSKEDIEKYNISFLNKFFDTKEEYIDYLVKHSISIAPRKQEGIGMSFLESISLGQCVIAYDDATMNEYIKNDVNGILTTFKNIINLDNYSAIGKKCKMNYKIGIKKYQNNIQTCIDFLQKDQKKYKNISFLDYIIDGLIKIRRFIIGLKNLMF